MGMVCAQPEGDGDDYLKRVNIRIQTVVKLNVAAYLVIAQYVRLADSFDGSVHCRDSRVEQPGDICVVFMLLCPSMELTVSMGTPLERNTVVAAVWRL